MNNDPELSGEFLGTVSSDFVIIADSLKEASYEIRSRGFSQYPIFPISKVEIPIGQLLIDKRDMALKWNYYVTYLNEFLERQLVDDQEAFEKAYKNPEEFCCLFVVDPDFTNFIFIPYPED